MKGQEIEFKYSAQEVTIEDFKNYCKATFQGQLHKETFGIDYFYENPIDSACFMRYRLTDGFSTLTFKRKLVEDNNVARLENNIDIHRMLKEDIDIFCTNLGFLPAFSIRKLSVCFSTDWFHAAYYICYDANMKELGRFIEIELDESVDYKSENDAINELSILEKSFKKIGLVPDKRISKSLFEMYKS